MFADGEDIYYYTANNQVYRLSIGEQYLINQLFKRPQLLTQPRTRITSMALLPHCEQTATRCARLSAVSRLP